MRCSKVVGGSSPYPSRGKYFAGDIDFGAMMEAYSILAGLEDAFTTLVSQMSLLLRMGAAIEESCCAVPFGQGAFRILGI